VAERPVQPAERQPERELAAEEQVPEPRAHEQAQEQAQAQAHEQAQAQEQRAAEAELPVGRGRPEQLAQTAPTAKHHHRRGRPRAALVEAAALHHIGRELALGVERRRIAPGPALVEMRRHIGRELALGVASRPARVAAAEHKHRAQVAEELGSQQLLAVEVHTRPQPQAAAQVQPLRPWRARTSNTSCPYP